MKRISVFLICILLLPISSSASDLTITENYWVQVFAATSQKSIDIFLQAHTNIAAHKIIHENGLNKILVGPYPSYSKAKGSHELKNAKGAFVRKHQDSSTPNEIITTREIEEEPTKNIITSQNHENENTPQKSILAKFLELFTKEKRLSEKDSTSSYTPNGSSFSDFVEIAKDGEIAHIDITPWGNNYDIMANEMYFSASGQQCRKLILFRVDKKFPEMLTTCKSANNNWKKVLSITSN